MYEVFYNLKAEPFRLSPDHRFCFEHKSYAKARAYMAYAFKRAEGFVMITGRPGTGKTTLIGELVESLSRDKVFTANLVCTQLSADDLLKSVAYSFGIGSAKLDKAELLQRLTILFHRWHREGRRALLIVDEAQDLSSSAMEELRLLTNIQIGGQPLLQIFLLGQPELRDLILSTAMEQVHQRIVAASHIDGLEAEETEAYVIHRLLAVGWNGDPAIDRAIFPLIHKFSEGVPRRINLICSRLFLLGSVEQRHSIELDDVHVVISELQAENLAAGTGISRHDFQASGSPEWVPVPLAASYVRPELQQQAANSGPFNTAAEEAQPGGAVGAKKKDIPGVAEVSHPAPASDSIAPYAATSHYGVEPQDDPGIEDFYQSGELVTDPLWAEPRFGWRRRIALFALVIVVVAVTLSLAAYVSDQQSETSSEYESEPHASSRHNSRLTALPVTTPDADAPVSAPLSEAVDAAPPIPVTSVPNDALRPVSIEAESFDRQTLQITAEEPKTLSQVPPDSATRNLNELAPANLSSEEKDMLAADGTTVQEQAETTFLVSFAFDSDDPLPDSHQALDSALEKLRDQPDSFASITGFTDSQGNEYYNLALSRKRADAVEQYLVDAGVARQRLQVEGRGVLTTPVDDQSPGVAFDMEPHRIVQIKLGSDPSQ